MTQGAATAALQQQERRDTEDGGEGDDHGKKKRLRIHHGVTPLLPFASSWSSAASVTRSAPMPLR